MDLEGSACGISEIQWNEKIFQFLKKITSSHFEE